MNGIYLDNKLVGDISGCFRVPSYQRGYRWSDQEVNRLLDDILASNGAPYCLQPIVVRNHGEYYELIDGQQRLTTLYLIYKFFHKSSNGFLNNARFRLEYQTREQSQQFLDDIDLSQKGDNIDYWFIASAYEAIETYFCDKPKSKITDLNKYFDTSVTVIWYEVPENEDARDLFTRLNIGKIPLTSSELVKALFLRRDSSIQAYQEEIALQWDNIERDLHDASLWSFLTNKNADDYPTRIDLILDLMAGKSDRDREDYMTFFHFDAMKDNGLFEIWQDILRSFLMLKEWRHEHELYHKIGYLIASGCKSLAEIFAEAQGKRKSEFKAYLDQQIKKSLPTPEQCDELYYNTTDYEQIERLLLYFNIESVRKLDNHKQWFPFDKHKEGAWTLEHIHAQHSEGLKTNEQWKMWLEDHLPVIKSLGTEQAHSLAAKMEQLVNDITANPKKAGVRERFEPLQQETVAMLSDESNEYIHHLSNMALLTHGDNAALSNYVFDAKRRQIIKWDQKGYYIPFCTKMVFYKYYSPSEGGQLNFWGETDRTAYMAAIKHTLYDPEGNDME